MAIQPCFQIQTRTSFVVKLINYGYFGICLGGYATIFIGFGRDDCLFSFNMCFFDSGPIHGSILLVMHCFILFPIIFWDLHSACDATISSLSFHLFILFCVVSSLFW